MNKNGQYNGVGLLEAIISFMLGGTLYVCIELIFRGRSHPSMFIAGAAAFVLMHGVYARLAPPLPLFCLWCAALVTAVELIAGYIVNIRLGLNVWDYSGERHNYRGQICLRFSACWGLLGIPAALLSRCLSGLF